MFEVRTGRQPWLPPQIQWKSECSPPGTGIVDFPGLPSNNIREKPEKGNKCRLQILKTGILQHRRVSDRCHLRTRSILLAGSPDEQKGKKTMQPPHLSTSPLIVHFRWMRIWEPLIGKQERNSQKHIKNVPSEEIFSWQRRRNKHFFLLDSIYISGMAAHSNKALCCATTHGNVLHQSM